MGNPSEATSTLTAPHPDFDFVEGNGAGPPQGASQRVARRAKNISISIDELTRLLGADQAAHIFDLYEAATTFHPSSESIQTAVRICARGHRERPSEREMALAGPALVTWLRRQQGVGGQSGNASLERFRAWVRKEYPQDADAARIRPSVNPRMTKAEYQALTAQGKKFCPECRQIKDVATGFKFNQKKRRAESYCISCGSNYAAVKRNRAAQRELEGEV